MRPVDVLPAVPPFLVLAVLAAGSGRGTPVVVGRRRAGERARDRPGGARRDTGDQRARLHRDPARPRLVDLRVTSAKRRGMRYAELQDPDAVGVVAESPSP
ncbi:hypothetical protein H3146_02890 [Streptomyces sp. OF3]|uniref:Uncharacterized protein n=1 Tax=Streptomyces alkaliterrae TaxID=2213162 RepID=A0A7W3WHB7_9ACTN|nr:hypothetical protein [Streptomyces alkaliterrae]MBB1252319.1 hypothetical protein [Streptomyces alkaliterrae]